MNRISKIALGVAYAGLSLFASYKTGVEVYRNAQVYDWGYKERMFDHGSALISGIAAGGTVGLVSLGAGGLCCLIFGEKGKRRN
jgi:hypothetical protein